MMGAHISTVDTHRADACMTKTGTYTGNGADNRDINIGVNLAAKQNVTVFVKAELGTATIWRTEYGQGDVSYFGDATADLADKIQSFTATRFQVGSTDHCNGAGQIIRYAAFWTEP